MRNTADRERWGNRGEIKMVLGSALQGAVPLATVRALQIKRRDDPHWSSVWYRPRNRRSLRPHFVTVDSVMPQTERHKNPYSDPMRVGERWVLESQHGGAYDNPESAQSSP